MKVDFIPENYTEWVWQKSAWVEAKATWNKPATEQPW